jgi:RND family efflux transporter MFP subunit
MEDAMQRRGIMSITIGGVATIVVLASVAACKTSAQSPSGVAAPPTVAVVAAQQRDLPLEASYTGRIEAIRTVELRPRVSGALEQVLFREGTNVSSGTPLFTIDKRQYEIALRRAEAEVATVNAQLSRAREEFERAERLVASDAMSVEELERRRAEVGTLEGRVGVAREQMRDAALNLEFTTVYAPFNGRVGKAEVTGGNLVNGAAGSATRLAVLHSVDPIFVYFELDPTTAARAMAQPRAGWRAVVMPFGQDLPVSGAIDFIDNGIGTDTGTLVVRAKLPNAEGRLLPGSVVKVAFQYGVAARAIVVPELAIGTDQGSRFVFVAGADDRVEYRPVSLGAKAGDWRVINTAVHPGERIVLPGLPGLRPGMAITPKEEVLR